MKNLLGVEPLERRLRWTLFERSISRHADGTRVVVVVVGMDAARDVDAACSMRVMITVVIVSNNASHAVLFSSSLRLSGRLTVVCLEARSQGRGCSLVARVCCSAAAGMANSKMPDRRGDSVRLDGRVCVDLIATHTRRRPCDRLCVSGK